MFGHQNDVITQDQKSDAEVQLADSAITALTTAPDPMPPTDSQAPVAGVPAMQADDEGVAMEPETLAPPPAPAPSVDGFLSPAAQASMPAEPVMHTPEPMVVKPHQQNPAPAPDPVPEPPAEPEEPQAAASAQDTPASSIPVIAPEDLLHIKQEALESLSPLVNTLDLPPEEKFRTLMMLIQASDDQSLLTTAYDAAKQIGDEKVRAKALLDVVNEINYFTQNQAASS